MTDTPEPGPLTLLPCPFCGGGASVERFGNTRVSTVYRCDDCGCALETGEEFHHGRAWNRRPSAPTREASGGVREPTNDEVEALSKGAGVMGLTLMVFFSALWIGRAISRAVALSHLTRTEGEEV